MRYTELEAAPHPFGVVPCHECWPADTWLATCRHCGWVIHSPGGPGPWVHVFTGHVHCVPAMAGVW